MTAHTTLAPASPACCDPLTGAFGKAMIYLSALRPRELKALNSPAALQDRIADIDSTIIVFRDYLKALVEDTAQHVALSQRQDSTVEAHMSDMASDLRKHFVEALERNR